VKVLVVGCGSMGRRHIRNLRDLGCEVDAIDLNEGQREAALGQEYPRPTGPFDALVVATPAVTHSGVFWGGSARHVFVEKPLAVTIADFAGAAPNGWNPRLTPAGGQVYQVGYNMRWHPGPVAMKAGLQGCIPTRAVFWTKSDRAAWKGQAYADALAECSHEIDLALWLLGPARCVVADATASGGRWSLELLHTTGVRSTVALSYVDDVYDRGALIATDQGSVEYHWDGGPFVGIGVPGYQYLQYTTVDIEDTYRHEIAAFLAAIREQRSSAVPLSDGLAVVEIMDQARRLAA
jgi:predicted dehydrogenase